MNWTTWSDSHGQDFKVKGEGSWEWRVGTENWDISAARLHSPNLTSSQQPPAVNYIRGRPELNFNPKSTHNKYSIYSIIQFVPHFRNQFGCVPVHFPRFLWDLRVEEVSKKLSIFLHFTAAIAPAHPCRVQTKRVLGAVWGVQSAQCETRQWYGFGLQFPECYGRVITIFTPPDLLVVLFYYCPSL